MTIRLTRLEDCFHDAICNQVATTPGDEITCQCGQKYLVAPGPEGRDQVRYGTFAQNVIVHGCSCPFASSFGGMLWGHRHQVARFLRGMGEALLGEVAEVNAVLPGSLGAKEGAE